MAIKLPLSLRATGWCLQAKGHSVLTAAEKEVFDTFGSGHFEAQLKDRKNDYDIAGGVQSPSPGYVYEEASGWVVYHFDDTSDTTAVRRWSAIKRQ